MPSLQVIDSSSSYQTCDIRQGPITNSWLAFCYDGQRWRGPWQPFPLVRFSVGNLNFHLWKASISTTGTSSAGWSGRLVDFVAFSGYRLRWVAEFPLRFRGAVGHGVATKIFLFGEILGAGCVARNWHLYCHHLLIYSFLWYSTVNLMFFFKVNSQMVEKVWPFAATPCSMHLAKVCSCVCCCIFGAGLTSQTLIFGKFAVVLCRWRSLFKEALVFFFRSVKSAGNLWASESAYVSETSG